VNRNVAIERSHAGNAHREQRHLAQVGGGEARRGGGGPGGHDGGGRLDDERDGQQEDEGEDGEHSIDVGLGHVLADA